MPNPNLSRQLRAVLEASPNALSLQDLLGLVDDFVLECTLSPDSEVLLFHLEEELQEIHHEVVDHSSIFQTEVFLAVLYHLDPILPATSVISWFDVVLRPALREPKLPTSSINHAKDLIIGALQKTEEAYIEKVKEFRCRLMDLYLLDAFNEGSGADVLEWAELDEEQRAKRSHWKRNLEVILLSFGTKQPENLMTEVYNHFKSPNSRLQLLMFLNLYTSDPPFSDASRIMANHPLTTSIIRCLLLDTSSTVCTAGLTLLVKLLPLYAINARATLNSILGKLLAVLARLICWKERPPSNILEPLDESLDPEFEQELDRERNRLIPISADLEWERLQVTFDATTSHPPSFRPFFTILYYLYPSNLLQFLSSPAQYLTKSGVTSPYIVDWPEVFAENEIRSKSERLIREHVCHPLLVWRDAAAELIEPAFWAKYTVYRMTSEAGMLDVRNTALAAQFQEQPAQEGMDGEPPEDDFPARMIRSIDLSSEKTIISLQDMINTTIALKSNLDVDIVQPDAQWPQSMFAMPQPPSEVASGSDEISPRIVQIISGLQREVLLLRNELNFELWLSRENVKYIGLLYQERVLHKSADVERQGLYNKLRNYRAQVVALEAELREHKQQASSAKNKYADWNTELQKKLKELRDEKKAWITEAANLRTAEKEARTLFAAQGRLLSEATNEVLLLQTQKKETQHKIDRLHDYERQIEQHVNMQRLWDNDFAKFNERKEQMDTMRHQYHQMKMQLESYQHTQTEMENSARTLRLRVQALEAQLAQAQTSNRGHNNHHFSEVAAANLFQENSALLESNKQLKEDNDQLKDEAEELRAMVSYLKAQQSGHKGLIAEHRASPVLFASSSRPEPSGGDNLTI